MKRIIQTLVVALAVVTPIFWSGTANALTNTKFTLTSDPTTAIVDLSHLTMPPLPGQPVTIHENLKNENGQPAGTADINCHVVAFTTTDLLLDCQATFNLTNGTITGHTLFWTFQHDYPAFALSGTGAYQGVIGTARVLDRAPGDETYIFNLYQL